MYDAIVIGSGIGGMTAAGLLAGVAGKKVLVLEKHTEPGGLTHVFRRDGASWDVGLHYVGDVAPGTQPRALFDYLSGGRLQWNRMPEAFERFVYPGLDFAVPADPERYRDNLIEAFPEEARAIRRYFRDVHRAARWTMLGFMRAMVPRPVAPLIGIVQRLTAGAAVNSTADYLHRHFRSPRLRALLASQWGDYGLPPGRSAFAIHAMIVSHYLHGAWFPVGGSAHVARSFEAGIERAGGAIRVGQEVVDILVEEGRAVGVRVLDRRGPAPQECIHRAPVIISNVGARLTFEKLLPTTGTVGEATAAVRRFMDRLGEGASAVTLYLRLREDARTLGVRGENCWINTGLDHDAAAARTEALLGGDPGSIYVSFPSIKSGEERFHTAEIIAFVDQHAFDPWRGQPRGQRGADYSALKERIGAGLLRLAETAIPGLTALVEYSELSTPLTVEHYTSHPGGQFYGLPATPDRYRSGLLGPRTPVPGLFLSGQDAGCLGIVGAMMGGMGAACQVLGSRGYPMIQLALRTRSRPAPVHAEAGDKLDAVLVAKRRLTPNIWALEFETAGPVAGYVPGQFARLEVGDGEWRDYSIAGLEGRIVRFLISTRTGGDGSRFIENVAPGGRTRVELPLGNYTLAPNDRDKVFVATGTGLAPFLPIFRQLAAERRLDRALLFFGFRTSEEDITAGLDPLPARVVRCVSRGQPCEGGFAGRVTAALADFDFDPERTDFYLCGSSAMVTDARRVLEQRGARHLFTESY
jgi:phytoene dehydrogenase-like protein/NAD(P)H-flavin reductase